MRLLAVWHRKAVQLQFMDVAAPSYGANAGILAAQAPLEISVAYTGITKFLTGQGAAATSNYGTGNSQKAGLTLALGRITFYE